jgi:hypothetical protein
MLWRILMPLVGHFRHCRPSANDFAAEGLITSSIILLGENSEKLHTPEARDAS